MRCDAEGDSSSAAFQILGPSVTTVRARDAAHEREAEAE
jgi:hypothetical protein